MRDGFSMLVAIIVVMLIGSLLYLSLSLGSVGVKATNDIYLKRQAELIARSFAEYEILKISGHSFSSSCYQGGQYDLKNTVLALPFEVNTSIRYIGNGFQSSCALQNSGIVNNESNGTALIDVIVSYIDPATGERVRFHRRTIQKP